MKYETTDKTIAFIPQNTSDAFKLGGIFRGRDLPCKISFSSKELLSVEIETKNILDMIRDSIDE